MLTANALLTASHLRLRIPAAKLRKPLVEQAELRGCLLAVPFRRGAVDALVLQELVPRLAA